MPMQTRGISGSVRKLCTKALLSCSRPFIFQLPITHFCCQTDPSIQIPLVTKPCGKTAGIVLEFPAPPNCAGRQSSLKTQRSGMVRRAAVRRQIRVSCAFFCRLPQHFQAA